MPGINPGWSSQQPSHYTYWAIPMTTRFPCIRIWSPSVTVVTFRADDLKVCGLHGGAKKMNKNNNMANGRHILWWQIVLQQYIISVTFRNCRCAFRCVYRPEVETHRETHRSMHSSELSFVTLAAWQTNGNQSHRAVSKCKTANDCYRLGKVGKSAS